MVKNPSDDTAEKNSFLLHSEGHVLVLFPREAGFVPTSYRLMSKPEVLSMCPCISETILSFGHAFLHAEPCLTEHSSQAAT